MTKQLIGACSHARWSLDTAQPLAGWGLHPDQGAAVGSTTEKVKELPAVVGG